MRPRHSRPIALLLLLGALAAASCGDPELSSETKAIVAGGPDPGHPAVGWLTTGNQTAHCTATLIAPRYALTAAHCLVPPALDLILGGESRSVRRKRVHPRYAKGAPGHRPVTFDIALIELVDPVSGIEPAVLAAAPPRIGERLIIVGFGVSAAGAGDHGVKRRAETTILRVTEQTLWLGAAHQTPPTTCNGDSGGPSFVVRDGLERLIGVHSASEGAPDSCTGVGEDVRVDVFAAFIEGRGERHPPGGEGDPCELAGDCAEGLSCAPAPHFVCARPCAQAGARCAGGERCFATGASSPATLCLPDSAGELGLGQRCDGRAQCADGVCLRTRDHGPRCTLFCDDPSTVCPSQTGCDSSMFSFAKVCLAEAGWQPPTPVTPSERAAFGAPCASNGSCAAPGLCRAIDGAAPRCTRACGPASPCPADHRCQTVGSRRLCVADGGGCRVTAGDGAASPLAPLLPTFLLTLLLSFRLSFQWLLARRRRR